jgi:hemerythrin
MTFVAWKKDYAVGSNTVDEQHQKLFSLLNRVESHVRRGSAKLDLDRVVTELEDYTKFHFSAEERTLEGMGGTEMPAHKRQHTYFVSEIAKARQTLLAGKTVDPRSLVVLLRDWLVYHILEVDKQAFDHIAATWSTRQGEAADAAMILAEAGMTRSKIEGFLSGTVES